jgi:hypothetical protein
MLSARFVRRLFLSLSSRTMPAALSFGLRLRHAGLAAMLAAMSCWPSKSFALLPFENPGWLQILYPVISRKCERDRR